jgi:hypothetical protein
MISGNFPEYVIRSNNVADFLGINGRKAAEEYYQGDDDRSNGFHGRLLLSLKNENTIAG